VAEASNDELDAGDIVWVDFGAPFGHEQAGRRPALVVSPRSYNSRSSLILVCPITRNVAPWPFKVDMPAVGRIRGAILVDHVRSIDRYARFVRRTDRVDRETLGDVHATMTSLLELPSRPNVDL
jgi:mRNA interferase MazF